MARKIRHKGIESAARQSRRICESCGFESEWSGFGGPFLGNYYMLWQVFRGFWRIDTVSCQLRDPKCYFFACLW